jgi:hypothetical protein
MVEMLEGVIKVMEEIKIEEMVKKVEVMIIRIMKKRKIMK